VSVLSPIPGDALLLGIAIVFGVIAVISGLAFIILIVVKDNQKRHDR
jgi:hypothetical protein